MGSSSENSSSTHYNLRSRVRNSNNTHFTEASHNTLSDSEDLSTPMESAGGGTQEGNDRIGEMESDICMETDKQTEKQSDEQTDYHLDKQGDLGFFGLGNDLFSVCVLMVLYVLQGEFFFHLKNSQTKLRY